MPDADHEESVLRTAKNMIAEYGANAGSQASMRLVDVRRGGDAEIIAYWRDVGAAIRKLQP